MFFVFLLLPRGRVFFVIPDILFSVIPSVAWESRGNDSFFFPATGVFSVIPSVAEESRGNETLCLFLSSCALQCGGVKQGVMYMFARKSRLLGKARPYYFIVPLFKHSFRPYSSLSSEEAEEEEDAASCSLFWRKYSSIAFCLISSSSAAVMVFLPALRTELSVKINLTSS